MDSQYKSWADHVITWLIEVFSIKHLGIHYCIRLSHKGTRRRWFPLIDCVIKLLSLVWLVTDMFITHSDSPASSHCRPLGQSSGAPQCSSSRHAPLRHPVRGKPYSSLRIGRRKTQQVLRTCKFTCCQDVGGVTNSERSTRVKEWKGREEVKQLIPGIPAWHNQSVSSVLYQLYVRGDGHAALHFKLWLKLRSKVRGNHVSISECFSLKEPWRLKMDRDRL